MNEVNGNHLEIWAEAERLSLIYDPKLSPSFNSGQWKISYDPYFIFVNDKLNTQTVKMYTILSLTLNIKP